MNADPLEFHPYGIFEVNEVRAFIIGTFPIGKFTNPLRRSEILKTECDFYYGGSNNKLWNTLARVFSEDLNSKEKRQAFLRKNKIAMADVIDSCKRRNGSAKDDDLYEQNWNPKLKDLLTQTAFPKIFFTSTKTKEWFDQFIFPNYPGVTEVLPSPAGIAMIPLARTQGYQDWLKNNPGSRVSDYLIFLYREKFKDLRDVS